MIRLNNSYSPLYLQKIRSLPKIYGSITEAELWKVGCGRPYHGLLAETHESPYSHRIMNLLFFTADARAFLNALTSEKQWVLTAEPNLFTWSFRHSMQRYYCKQCLTRRDIHDGADTPQSLIQVDTLYSTALMVSLTHAKQQGSSCNRATCKNHLYDIGQIWQKKPPKFACWWI